MRTAKTTVAGREPARAVARTLALAGLAAAAAAFATPANAAIVVVGQEISALRNKTITAVFTPATGVLTITLDNDTITDPGGQRETVIVTSDPTGNQANIANSQNTSLITFGNDAFPVTSVTITITGTNPVVAGLGGLVNLAPDVPAVAGYGPLNEPVDITGGAERDTFIVLPRQSMTINGGGGDDTFVVKGSTAGVPVNLNGEDGDDQFTFTAMPPAGSIVNVDGGPHPNGDTLTVFSKNATLNDTGGQISGSGVGTVFYSNIESRSIFDLPVSVPATSPWALVAIALGVLGITLRMRRRA